MTKFYTILLFFISIFALNTGISHAESQEVDSAKFIFNGTITGIDESKTTKLNLELLGNLEKTSPTLDLNVEKITINKYHFWHNPEITLYLKADDEGTYPKITDIITNEFFITEKQRCQ